MANSRPLEKTRGPDESGRYSFSSLSSMYGPFLVERPIGLGSYFVRRVTM